MPPHSLVINPSGVARFIDGQALPPTGHTTDTRGTLVPSQAPVKRDTATASTHPEMAGQRPRSRNGRSVGSHGQMARRQPVRGPNAGNFPKQTPFEQAFRQSVLAALTAVAPPCRFPLGCCRDCLAHRSCHPCIWPYGRPRAPRGGHGQTTPARSRPGAPAAGQDTLYGFGRIDAAGRVADRSVIRVLRWQGGDQLTLTADAGVVTARGDPAGMAAMTAKPYITIPAAPPHYVQ